MWLVNPIVILVAQQVFILGYIYHGCLCLKSSSATYAYKYNIFIIATIIFPSGEKLVT